MDSWLARSGQAWKMTFTDVATLAAVILIVAGFAIPHPAPALFGIAAGIAGVGMPLAIRCRVCGVQVATTPEARALTRVRMLEWVRVLEVCPSCFDDGYATDEAVRAWTASGRPKPAAYWDARRILVAVLFTVIALGALHLIAVYDRVAAR